MATKTDDNQNDAEPEEIVDVDQENEEASEEIVDACLLYTSPSPRDA